MYSAESRPALACELSLYSKPLILVSFLVRSGLARKRFRGQCCGPIIATRRRFRRPKTRLQSSFQEDWQLERCSAVPLHEVGLPGSRNVVLFKIHVNASSRPTSIRESWLVSDLLKRGPCRSVRALLVCLDEAAKLPPIAYFLELHSNSEGAFGFRDVTINDRSAPKYVPV